MKRATVSIVAFLWLFLSVPMRATAEEQSQEFNATVQGLLQQCKALSDPQTQNGYGALYCLGYVTGAADVLLTLGLSGTAGICGKISYEAAVQAFVNWATAHPERWTNDRLLGVTVALRETWPCNNSSK